MAEQHVDMDETLAGIRDLCERKEPLSRRETQALQRAILRLDDWLSRGGYRPARWAGKGVNLDLPETAEEVAHEIAAFGKLFEGKTALLHSRGAQLVVAVLPYNAEGGEDSVVAAFASHVVVSHNPAQAVRELAAQLASEIKRAQMPS